MEERPRGDVVMRREAGRGALVPVFVMLVVRARVVELILSSSHFLNTEPSTPWDTETQTSSMSPMQSIRACLGSILPRQVVSRRKSCPSIALLAKLHCGTNSIVIEKQRPHTLVHEHPSTVVH